MSSDTASSCSQLCSNKEEKRYKNEADTILSMTKDENKYLMKKQLFKMSTINYKDENEKMDDIKSNEESQLITSYEYNRFINTLKFYKHCLNCIIMMLLETRDRARGKIYVSLCLVIGLKKHIDRPSQLAYAKNESEQVLVGSKIKIRKYKTGEKDKSKKRIRKSKRKSLRHRKQSTSDEGKKYYNNKQLFSSNRKPRSQNTEGCVLGGSGAGGKLLPP